MRIARWAMVVATVLLAGMPMRAQTTQTAPPAQTCKELIMPVASTGQGSTCAWIIRVTTSTIPV